MLLSSDKLICDAVRREGTLAEIFFQEKGEWNQPAKNKENNKNFRPYIHTCI